MNTSVDPYASNSKFEDQPTLGVFLNEAEGRIFICAGDEDCGQEVSPMELSSLYQTYRVCFFDAEKILSWLKKHGVTQTPKCFDCIVSQNRLTTSGVALTIESLVWYWWEERVPTTDCERAWATFSLDDSPSYDCLIETGTLPQYKRRLGRIADFINGR